MKRNALLLLAAFVALMASAQYMPMKNGIVFTYEAKSAEENTADNFTSTVTDFVTDADGTIRATVVEKHHIEGSLIGDIEQPTYYSFNPADKMTTYIPVAGEDYKKLVLSGLRQMFEAAGQYPSDQDMADLAKKLKPKGDLVIELPDQAVEGAQMPNSTIRMSIEGQPAGIKLVKATYQGYEDVATDAGTFHCLKVAYTISVIGQGADQKVTSWFAPNVGMVKQETTDKKGKPVESTILKSITND